MSLPFKLAEKRSRSLEEEDGASSLVHLSKHHDHQAGGGNKRLKTAHSELYTTTTATSGSKPGIDASELASAFALASLASLSPVRNKDTIDQQQELEESRDLHVVRKKSMDMEKDEVRSAVSFDTQSSSSKATNLMSTPDHSPSSRTDRRVSFSPCTKEGSRVQVVSTPPPLPGLSTTMVPPQTPQRNILPPRSPRGIAMAMASPRSPDMVMSPPHAHAAGAGGYGQPPRPPHPAYLHPYGAPPRHPMAHPFTPRHPFHHPYAAGAAAPWMHRPHPSPPPHHPHQQPHGPSGAGFVPGTAPSSLMQPALNHPPAAGKQGQWICDFCNVASFQSYKEACAHEQVCKMKSHNHNNRTMGEACHTGAITLDIPQSDQNWLSDLDCFIRSECVEAFTATPQGMVEFGKTHGRISYGQVGIQCRFCKHIPTTARAVAAVSFPTTVNGIYESVKRWQRSHLESCKQVPDEVVHKLSELTRSSTASNNSSKNSNGSATRQYWAESAKALSMIDTTEGIRFAVNPYQRKAAVKSIDTSHLQAMVLQDGGASQQESSTEASARGGRTDYGNEFASTGERLVTDQEQDAIPPYVFYLMSQVEPCTFTEADRFVARSKGPIGYAGFQCRHCHGHAGLGKYFPVSAKSLSTNSTSQNIHAHLLKCRKTPDHIKDQLVQLKIEKGRTPRLEPGWRKIFFDKIWTRLHGEP